jgi:asparagine synthase (glutamine-hydrolysing)
MCGICGIYNFRNGAPVDAGVVEAMKTTLAHRGPDGHGSYVDGSVGLGHRRLSIIDLSDAARQPLGNEDQTIWVVCNGEVYNYRELRRQLADLGHEFYSASDTEVLVHLYEEYGVGFLERVEGMFALAVWDSKSKELILARDRLGIKPLYYQLDSAGIAFASEIKGLLVRPKARFQLDQRALLAYLLHAQIPAPRTAYSNTHKLQPAHLIRIRSGAYTVHRYWDLPRKPQKTSQTEDEIIEELSAELSRVCRSHLVSDVPVGAFLSGGLDSSTIVSLAASHATDPIRTFCVSFKNHPNEDESSVARRVANASRTIHTEHDMQGDFVDELEHIVGLGDEPFAIASAFALYGIARIASDDVKVALSGDGADELFAGYPRHYRRLRSPIGWNLGDLVANATSTISRKLTSTGTFGRYVNPLGMKVLRRFYTPFLSRDRYYQHLIFCNDLFISRQLLDAEFYREHIKMVDQEVVDQFLSSLHLGPREDEINRRLSAEVRTTLVDEMLTKVDRMSMAWGLEVRVPFLDHKLVELAMSIPGSMKYDGQGGKKIMKRAVKGALPDEVIAREKHGFNPPLATWFRGELGGYLEEQLSTDILARSGVFNQRVVRDALHLHRQGNHDFSTLLITVLTWTLWYRHATTTHQATIEGWSRG